MDRETELHILNTLRWGTVTWHLRTECLNRGRRKRIVGKTKDGRDKHVWERSCDSCGIWQDLKDSPFEVDHIEEIGSFNGNFDTYIRRMYCSLDNLQALCFSCHREKTNFGNAARAFKRKIAS